MNLRDLTKFKADHVGQCRCCRDKSELLDASNRCSSCWEMGVQSSDEVQQTDDDAEGCMPVPA